jgi:hypothetical protein
VTGEVALVRKANAGGDRRQVEAATPPQMAPIAVATSSVMPSRMLAVPRSTLVLATALEVAITERMLVATA